MDWKSIVGTVAPALAMALGGPLAGSAVKLIAGAVLGDEAAGEAEVARAVAGMTPEQLAALKSADHDFAVKMRELDIDLDRIAAGDRVSARRMQSDTRSWVPGALAMLITAGFFGVLAWMLGHGLPSGGGSEAMLVMLGALGTAWGAVVNFYYGSSAGSERKTAMLTAAGR